MGQKEEKILPGFLNLDTAYEKLLPNETPYLKNVSLDSVGNPPIGIGSNNPSGEGQNSLVLTPIRSNKAIPIGLLPSGYRLTIGSFESKTTQEEYHFNYNGNGNHGIYVLDGNTGVWNKVVVDPQLGFSNDPAAFISEHRVSLRVIYNSDMTIKEKYLIITDGNSWQKYINVIAAIKTNGFDASLFPYWKLQPPHFDRRELLEYAVRPPMVKPIVSLLLNSNSDFGKINYLADKAFQFCYERVYTDGRPTASSPLSLPEIVSTTDYISNSQNLPKKAQLVLDAGSPMVEKMYIYVRQAKVEDGKGSKIAPEWGDWYLYDTIFKFNSSGPNDPSVIGANYWLRTGQWADYNYDSVFNTVKYVFDNSKQGQIVSQDKVNQLFNEIPIRSKALSDLGDAILLGNNELNYDNFSKTVLNKFNVTVQERNTNVCAIPQRTVRVYAYIGRCNDNFTYISQVGYFSGSDKQMRFGGLNVGPTTVATVDINESKGFGLDFSDRSALRVYAKGTPYYADGVWYQVHSDNSMVKLPSTFDFSNADVLTGVQTIFDQQGYFICVFDLVLPAGRYDLALARHNTSSSGDFRGQSTYVMGIADSRKKTQSGVIFTAPIGAKQVTTIKPSAIAPDFSKEMEVDCTSGNVDVWGSGRDLFYVYCPYTTHQSNGKHRFIEGYLFESGSNPLPVEKFGYFMDHGATDDNGKYTDKNGFYFSYTKVANADIVNIQFNVNINCSGSNSFTFLIPTSQVGIGWMQNPPAYLSDHNNGQVGDCNRVIVSGKITSLDGLIPYSNIAVSIVGGSTAYTKSDGTFQLVVHNGGTPALNRVDNIYINAGGNFQITADNCGSLPLIVYDEINATCVNCSVRNYPFPINLKLNIVAASDTSLKEAGKFPVAVYGADLAGRLMYANPLGEFYIPSFLERNRMLPTYLQAALSSALQLNQNYPDIKWITFAVGKNSAEKKYVQWVGDSIQYIDNAGNVVTNSATAVFCAISIQSLINFNIGHNFSTLADYQFVKGDRLRVLDDGNGNLLNVAGFGDPIDVQILGTNYNQAAINAQLLPQPANTVLNTTGSTAPTNITVYVRYDQRLDKLINSTGFWIELYTPSQSSDIYPYFEAAGFYPVINGEIAQFAGYANDGSPSYNYPTTFNIDYWDTYLIRRNISVPGAGDKYFNHIFESPNVNDSFGGNLASGGRQWIKNDNAKRQWFMGDTIKSDVILKTNQINGIGTFRGNENRKDFSAYPWGGIVSMHSERSIVFFLCENDWFTTNFNFNYTYPNEQGIMVVSLTDGLSSPHQKTTGKYGCSHEHTGTIIYSNGMVSWYDLKNAAFVISDYSSAEDVSDIIEKRNGQETKIGIKSYMATKSNYISNYNNAASINNRFDVISGIDLVRKNIYLTFRKRNGNSNNPLAFVNTRRNIDLAASETFVFNLESKRWTMLVGFTPECYGKLRGRQSGVEMITYAAGAPYIHNYSGNKSFNNFYGVQTEPVVIADFNKEHSAIKILQNIIADINGAGMYVDMIYTDEPFSFSYIPFNLFKNKKNQYYASVLRNMVSYPPVKDELFRSMLVDGKRVKGAYFIIRLVGDPLNQDKYFQFKNLYVGYIASEGESIMTGEQASKA